MRLPDNEQKLYEEYQEWLKQQDDEEAVMWSFPSWLQWVKLQECEREDDECRAVVRRAWIWYYGERYGVQFDVSQPSQWRYWERKDGTWTARMCLDVNGVYVLVMDELIRAVCGSLVQKQMPWETGVRCVLQRAMRQLWKSTDEPIEGIGREQIQLLYERPPSVDVVEWRWQPVAVKDEEGKERREGIEADVHLHLSVENVVKLRRLARRVVPESMSSMNYVGLSGAFEDLIAEALRLLWEREGL